MVYNKYTREDKDAAYKKSAGRSYRPRPNQPGEFRTQDEKARRPSKHEEMHPISGVLSQKAMKDLKFGTIMVAGDPYTAPIGSGEPYPLVNSNNKVLDANYDGVENLAGNTMVTINDANNARLLKMYDAAYTDIVMNYLYTNRPTDAGQAMNYQLGKATEEALALLDAEMVRGLPFMDDVWTTNMQHMDMNNRLAPLIWYQASLQNCIQAIQRYNTTIAMESTLMKMGFLREAPIIKELYSQFKKTTFREAVDNVGTNLTGEYIDVDWMRQVNGITAVPSRRTDSKMDPLLTINATHWLPHVTETTSDSSTVVFNSDSVKVTVSTTYFGTVEYDNQKLSAAIQEMLSPTTILSWARQVAAGTATMNSKQYTNDLTALYTGLMTLSVMVSQYMGVVRTILYRLALSTKTTIAATGIVKWETGIGFAAGLTNEAPVVYNKLANDIFRGILCGPADLTWNDQVSAWTFFSLWNLYYGIPEFDRMSGGAFLSFSLRTIPPLDEGESPIAQKRLYPIMFTHSGKATFVNRVGEAVQVVREQIQGSSITSNNKFARLQLGPYSIATLNVPYFNWADAALDPLAVSYLNLALLKVYGMAHQHRNDTIWIGDNTVDDYDMEADIVGTVDMQQISPANALITFARSNAPLMVQYVPSSTGSIGFKKRV